MQENGKVNKLRKQEKTYDRQLPRRAQCLDY